jgi:hypothetical protein
LLRACWGALSGGYREELRRALSKGVVVMSSIDRERWVAACPRICSTRSPAHGKLVGL